MKRRRALIVAGSGLRLTLLALAALPAGEGAVISGRHPAADHPPPWPIEPATASRGRPVKDWEQRERSKRRKSVRK